MPHLWETERPAAFEANYTIECEDFAELRDDIDKLPPNLNHIYGWMWWHPNHTPHPDEQAFSVYIITGDEGNRLLEWTCPITEEQEPEVLEWLRGDRVLGALRRAWEPLLDETTRKG